MKQVGAVSYLNTKPLVHGLQDALEGYEVIFDVPSRLSDRLRDGQLDVALIPVVEAVANPDYRVVSDAAIACHGPVRSVKIVSRVEPEQIHSLALDIGSRTSVMLSRILLYKRHGVKPECRPLPLDFDYRDEIADAVLMIGDRAMRTLATDDPSGFRYEWDLGETWYNWTGLPFVFAVWTARPGADLETLAETLACCRDAGLASLDQIAEDNAARYGLEHDECLAYLRDQLHFYLGAEERKGLSQFLDYARELSLISGNRQLTYHDCGLAGQSR